MTVPPALELAALLAEDQWIRRLARRLAADSHVAEDLAQDAWVEALSARERPRAGRPWLAGVVRNLWLDLRHAKAGRARRERRAAREEALPSAGELVGELELRRAVAAALLELEEPYRRALYLRFFKDHSLAELARREGIALSTAHERVQQGLARLRSRLDRENGGRAWCAGLLSLAKPASGWTAVTEAIAMAGGLKVAASVLVLGGGVAWWWLERGEEHERAPLAAEAPAQAAADVPPDVLATVESPPARAALEARPESSPAAGAEPRPTLVRGRVVDVHGFSVGSVAVGWAGGTETAGARSAADGSFELEGARSGEAEVVCREPGLVTLVPGASAALGRPESWVVVVAPRADFAGIVLDPAGAPVPEAQVSFGLREALFRELGLHRGSFERPGWQTRTDAAGAFALPGVAGGERAYLQVEAEGFWIASAELPPESAADLVVRLERATGARTITGLVLDSAGAAVPGARVSAGDAIVTSDADGRFELVFGPRAGTFGPDEGGDERDELRDAFLVALKAGLRPARERLADLDLAAPVVLVLGARPESIAGRVLDAEGAPRAGVIVWPRDVTPFGREVQAMAEGTTVAWGQTVEDELAGGFGKLGALSDAHGAFELGGLLPRPYELMAFDPDTAELSGPWTVAAGSRGVELVLAREERRGRVAGRVVSAGGVALSGVTLQARRNRGENDAHSQPPSLRRHAVTSDSEGRFDLGELALADTELLLEHPRFFLRAERLADHPDPAHLELVEAVLCELQVDLTDDPGFADSVKVLDADARELEAMESFGNGWSLGTEARFSQGLTSVVSVRETAATLVFFKAGVEVLRRPLRLDPEQRVVVKP